MPSANAEMRCRGKGTARLPAVVERSRLSDPNTMTKTPPPSQGTALVRTCRRQEFGSQNEQEADMAKSQKRSNREPKKPKMVKAPVEPVAAIGFPGKQVPARKSEGSKKG